VPERRKMMKKLSKLFLALALAVTFLKPCPVCEELKEHGTEEELLQHIEEVHGGVQPCVDLPPED